MKVYMVDEMYYDSYQFHGIFSTFEKALSYCKATKSCLSVGFLNEDNIEEVIVDSDCPN